MTGPVLRIGTRGSPLALAQTELARNRIVAAGHRPAGFETMEVVPIRTSGDRFVDRALVEIGGKGLFTREIDEAMLAGHIDLAVHSVKDLPTKLPPGITLAAILPRGDPRDAAILRAAGTLAELPPGAMIGTTSLRRQAQLLNRRPDLRIVPLRGNVKSRLQKVLQQVTDEGSIDGTILALCGLHRLGIADVASSVLAVEDMLPAVGQGAIAITCRSNDVCSLDLLAAVNDRASACAIEAERAMLATLDGSCRTPIAGLATVRDETINLIGMVLSPDGSRCHRIERTAPIADALHLGEAVGDELRRSGVWTWGGCAS